MGRVKTSRKPKKKSTCRTNVRGEAWLRENKKNNKNKTAESMFRE
jgi:hypothetical protein